MSVSTIGVASGTNADQLSISGDAVKRWQRRYLEEGNVNTQYARDHRPVKMDDVAKEAIILKAVEDSYKSAILVKKFTRIYSAKY